MSVYNYDQSDIHVVTNLPDIIKQVMGSTKCFKHKHCQMCFNTIFNHLQSAPSTTTQVNSDNEIADKSLWR